ncbi:oxidoreductase NAD-binding domain-containing protein 1-like [Anneissia japonica]|uniref:oxidoreductase NAD-binding domain-containing protein 1-like n=1 Tax=Anneissia japonica TaxID=1529436 RepID=UPI001425742D|nr:oxidoreductase NAD-binding domain-containing protein 1-like [Anneissia japonica]
MFLRHLQGKRALTRAMSVSRQGGNHLEKTAHEARQKQKASEAEVVEVNDMSPTVKRILLNIDDPAFNFKAGQWVDFFIPGVEIFTGFSMSSSPDHLQSGYLELAVQLSDYPPTLWVHEECKVGSKVSLRVGGTQMVYDPQPNDPSYNILLIAGGIGINPLLSILRHAESTHRAHKPWFTGRSFRLLYSASTQKELIFHDKILAIVNTFPLRFQSQFFVTQEDVPIDGVYAKGRIQESDLARVVNEFGADKLKCYICGPPPMIEDMEAKLLKLKLNPDNLHYEKWW